MWVRAKDWLQTNPNATPPQLREAIGCARSTSQSFIKKWQRINRMDQESLAPGPVRLKSSRVPVDDLPFLTREAVIEEMRRMYDNIELLNKRFNKEAGKLLPAHLAQMSGAIQNLVKAAQLLGDSYPGLSSLVAQGGDTSEDVMQDDISAADDWLGLSVVK